MGDGVELFQRPAVGKNDPAQGFSIQLAAGERFGKSLRKGCEHVCVAFQQLMVDLVTVKAKGSTLR